VEYCDVELFPAFAFDATSRLRPRQAIREINRILTRDAWSLAFWFSSACSLLNGQRPLDVIAEDRS
jgi:hypothetical protein